ncbi:hypothetical protein ERJ75_000035500 [Trypanosoma vivax]|nr:hypothetical protein TRVL_00821 [Trypanosoma vivax]KAH8620546.1 hypothetical protein ERJ75_000035500 [Trypanosoma vivax]
MSCSQVANLEERAAAAETALAELKTQLSIAQSALGDCDAGLQSRLQQLLVLLQEDRKECETIRAQRDELREENDRLKVLVAKHEYRIKHLMRTINELESKDQS